MMVTLDEVWIQSDVTSEANLGGGGGAKKDPPFDEGGRLGALIGALIDALIGANISVFKRPTRHFFSIES